MREVLEGTAAGTIAANGACDRVEGVAAHGRRAAVHAALTQRARPAVRGLATRPIRSRARDCQYAARAVPRGAMEP